MNDLLIVLRYSQHREIRIFVMQESDLRRKYGSRCQSKRGEVSYIELEPVQTVSPFGMILQHMLNPLHPSEFIPKQSQFV